MTRKILFLLSILFCLLSSSAQKGSGASSIAASGGDTSLAIKKRLQADEWIKQSLSNIRKPGEVKTDLDTAVTFAEKARQLCKAIQYTKGYNEALYALSIAHIEKGDSRTAFRLIEQADDTTRVHILLQLENYYYYGGQITQSDDSARLAVEKALTCLPPHKYPALELEVRSEIMYLSILAGKSEKVDEQYAAALLLKPKVPVEDFILMLHCLAVMYYEKGDLNQSLRFALDGLRYSEQTNKFMIERMYSALGSVYKSMNEFEKCIDAHSKAMAINKANKEIARVWISCDWICGSLSQLKRYDEALQLVYTTEKEVGFSSAMDEAFYYRTLGRLFLESGNKAESDKAFWGLAKVVEEKNITDPNTLDFLCKFFFRIKDYEKSRQYAERVLKMRNLGDIHKMSLHMTLFSLDTAAGDYKSAVKTLQKLQALQDTIRNVEKQKNIRRLLVQYETEKKDKDLKLQQQAIELLSREKQLQEKDLEQTRMALTFETEAKQRDLTLASLSAAEKDKNILLQQQNIALLEKDAQLKDSRISKAGFIRDIMLTGALLLLIIILLLYNRYRLKRKNAAELAQKNNRLGELVNEKELLLKEVHHRVKNNLHTIISLLESQASFLSDDALTAIQKSQHRIYSMSLIHQKLYQNDNATTVKMDIYLKELLAYLKDSFELSGIRFETELEPIELDISQAIPLGLILNEAITNSIKYAFPGKQSGIITISLTETEKDRVHLHISDNGIGLPPGWDEKINQSLGVKLIKGLSEDIQADLHITSREGTSIEVDFRKATFG